VAATVKKPIPGFMIRPSPSELAWFEYFLMNQFARRMTAVTPLVISFHTG